MVNEPLYHAREIFPLNCLLVVVAKRNQQYLAIFLSQGGGGGGGLLPYMGYTGTCHWIGYGFWPVCPEQGI